MIDNNILLRLLLEADETEDSKKEEDDRPKGFDEDPMGFILNKYEGLDSSLKELMGDHYRQYLTAVFIIADKPTTFKVILHNGQFFFMSFMGNNTYECNVAGKRYYLNNLGTKESAMLAIVRLLKFGNPLNTKGSPGAEEGTRPEENLAAATGEEAGGGEVASTPTQAEPAAPAEELQESKILQYLLKEAKISDDFLSKIEQNFNDSGFTGKRNSKNGKHLRYDFRTSTGAEEIIATALRSISPTKFYKITEIPANEYAKGAKSGTFTTYKIEVIKAVGDLKVGDELFVVNQSRESSAIVGKSLTPTVLGLSNSTFKNAKTLVSKIDSTSKKLKTPYLPEVLSALSHNVENATSPRFKSVKDITEYTESLPLDNTTSEALSHFSDADINTIGKDFGEILGAITLLKAVKDPGEGVFFPGGNEPLADFYIDGYAISSKYKGGAAASLSDIVKKIDPKQLTTKNQKALYVILKTIIDSKVSTGYITVAKSLALPGYDVLANIIGQDVSPASIDNYIQSIIKNAKTNEQRDAIVMKKFKPYYQEIGRSPKNNSIDWDKLKAGRYYGIITSPLAYYLADKMNENKGFKSALIEILSKIEVKQLYLDFSLKKKAASFKLKSFSDPNANFKFDVGSVSTYNPESSKLAFKML